MIKGYEYRIDIFNKLCILDMRLFLNVKKLSINRVVYKELIESTDVLIFEIGNKMFMVN